MEALESEEPLPKIVDDGGAGDLFKHTGLDIEDQPRGTTKDPVKLRSASESNIMSSN